MKCLTKIVATVGPACVDEKILKKMILTGVSVFRLNLKHNDINWHKNVIGLIGKITAKNKKKVGIMIDLLGPELRVTTSNNIDVEVRKGEEICLADTFIPNRKSLTLSKNGITKDIKVGQKIYIDNGLYEFRVAFSKLGLIILKSNQDCLIKNGKSVAINGFENRLPPLTHKDFDTLNGLSKLPIDFVCLSFCRTADDVNKLKQVLLTKNVNANIVAKIENRMALENIEEIIEASDIIMIARGDLGVEIPLREIAYWQKEIIRKCRLANKPVIVATQMMESMVEKSIPTRAEVSDVANAVYDGADSLMLSGETAVGKYPIAVIKQMRSICQFSEVNRNIDNLIKINNDIGDLVVDSVRNLVVNSGKIKMDKILVFSKSGKTARKIASFRLGIPIIGITDSAKVYKNMFLNYATIPYFKKIARGKFDVKGKIIYELIKNQVLVKNDRVIVVHGQNWLVSSSTNEVGVFEV